MKPRYRHAGTSRAELLTSSRHARELLPSWDARQLVCRHYVINAVAFLSKRIPERARAILLDSLSQTDDLRING